MKEWPSTWLRASMHTVYLSSNVLPFFFHRLVFYSVLSRAPRDDCFVFERIDRERRMNSRQQEFIVRFGGSLDNVAT